MKVVFIRSGNSGIDPISTNQGNSLSKLGIEIIYFDIIGKGINGYLKNIFLFRKFVKQSKPDVLHAHYSLSGIVAVASFTGKPVICSLMGSDIYSSSKIFKLFICFFHLFFWKKTIVKSKEMKALFFNQGIVIPNGVSFENFFPIPKIEAQNQLNWSPSTRHILFASSPQRPEKNFELAKIILEKLNFNYELHFLENITLDQLNFYFNASDVLLMTSKHEGSPNVIKEALATNCPIISSNVGDVKTNIQNSNNCFIFDLDKNFDLEKIIAAFETIIFNENRSNGREKIQHLNDKIIAKKIIEIYKESIK